MKVIVTGGAGFIGSHLIERLLREKNIKKIIVFDNFINGKDNNIKKFKKNKKVKIIHKDINNIKKNDHNFKYVNCIFHLAALADIVPSIVDPIKYCQSNFNGTLKILEAMRYNNVNKIIYSASSSCYGIPDKYPTHENSSIRTLYPYAFSKYIGELAIQHWAQVYKIKFISLRLFNVYGTRARTTGAYGAVMGVFLKQKIAKKPLTVVGSGNQKRDFINVKDVCEAFIKGFKTTRHNKIYNVGSSKPISVNALTKFISKKVIHIPKRPGEPFQTFANISKIKKELKWNPKIVFKHGIKELLDNISHWKKAPLWDKEKIKKATKDWFKYLK
jgi:UDP-glucose 4-epimerase